MSDLKLKDTTVALKTVIAEKVTKVEDTEGTFTLGKEVYMESLPEGIEPEQVEALQKHNEDFIAALALVGGEKSIDVMEGNKKVTTTSIEAPMGADTAKVSYTRHKEGKIGFGDKKGQKWETWVNPMATVTVKASSRGSQLGRVFDHLKTTGSTRLKK